MKNTHAIWLDKLTIHITDKGRFKALSPCGSTGFGRTKDAAIRDCAEHAGIKLHS